jgi:hypothetical protein
MIFEFLLQRTKQNDKMAIEILGFPENSGDSGK